MNNDNAKANIAPRRAVFTAGPSRETLSDPNVYHAPRSNIRRSEYDASLAFQTAQHDADTAAQEHANSL